MSGHRTTIYVSDRDYKCLQTAADIDPDAPDPSMDNFFPRIISYAISKYIEDITPLYTDEELIAWAKKSLGIE